MTELVTNSVRHAGAPTVELRVMVTRPAVRVEIANHGPGFEPEQRTKDQDPEGGWGLFLVDASRIAGAWRGTGRARASGSSSSAPI